MIVHHRPIRRLAAVLAALVLVASCSEQPAPSASSGSSSRALLEHDIVRGPFPWTDRDFAYDPDVVRFAVFADLTGGEREGIFEIAIEQLNMLRPELIVNVGDLIEGSTDRVELNRQWDSFDARAGKAQAPVFYTGGNHDLLGKEMREAWQDRVGPRFYYFRYRDILFLVLDTEDYPSARLEEIAQMRREAAAVAARDGWDAFRQTPYARMPEVATGYISQLQSDYMVRALADNADVRWTFLLMHKAPWKNADMRSWNLLERSLQDRPYTVFHGHRHAYLREERNGRDYIRLATTGGVFQPENGLAVDQLVWVTVDSDGAHIANLQMSGILDKTGHLPLNGDNTCLEIKDCFD
jgi:hypothetical protein